MSTRGNFLYDATQCWDDLIQTEWKCWNEMF